MSFFAGKFKKPAFDIFCSAMQEKHKKTCVSEGHTTDNINEDESLLVDATFFPKRGWLRWFYRWGRWRTRPKWLDEIRWWWLVSLARSRLHASIALWLITTIEGYSDTSAAFTRLLHQHIDSWMCCCLFLSRMKSRRKFTKRRTFLKVWKNADGRWVPAELDGRVVAIVLADTFEWI